MTGLSIAAPSAPVVYVPPGIQIDHGIPIPPKKRLPCRNGHYGAYVKYPWRKMEPGDSFAVPVERDPVREQIKVTQAMRNQQRRHSVRYTSRGVVEDGRLVIRVWRIA